MPRSETISVVQARRVALAAQGFAEKKPRAVTRLQLARLCERLGAIQIDSVNALVRSHYLPAFSRLGGYDPSLLDRLAYAPKRRELFEYWGHEASLMPLDLQPLFRWRMKRAERFEDGWTHVKEMGRTQRAFVARVLEEIKQRGPLAAGELNEGGKAEGSWWGWSDGKRAVEWLFWAGKLTTAYRRGFERVYDLSERVFPPEILAQPTPSEAEAHRRLLLVAARAHGIATERDLRDYFRIGAAEAKPRVAELVESGDLLSVRVEGWKQPAYLLPGTKIPRMIDAAALLSPFDSLIWERTRTEQLFDFNYRLEIYTPSHKRVHGYYVLPFLCGERLVARVDLKSSRKDKALDVHGVHYEKSITDTAIERLAGELRAMADWMGHESVRVLPSSVKARQLRALLRG
jgi:uncharacterized protein YcaQ